MSLTILEDLPYHQSVPEASLFTIPAEVVLCACSTILEIGGPRHLVSVPDYRVLVATEGSA